MADAKAQNRYRVIERLRVQMAEVFRGESESVAGFKKAVAIKRVLPHLASNGDFIRMFLDEARLSARLTHANIAQTFDIGHVENTYFIVMEFIDGVNLKGAIEFLKSRRQTMPVPLPSFIAQKVCEGLHYAHEATDSDGNLLNIVHRDISPPNVLLSRRGEVKIVDFGLAGRTPSRRPSLASSRESSATSPETAMGKEADPWPTSTPWASCCGRCSPAESSIRATRTTRPSSWYSRAWCRRFARSIRPYPKRSTSSIRARARPRQSQPLPTAQIFGEEVSGFLFANKLKVSSVDIGKMVNEVVADKQSAKRDGKTEGSVINQFIQEELLRFTSLGDPSSGPESDPRATPAPDHDGARPLDANQFVSLSSWASDVVGDDAFDPSNLGSSSSWSDAPPGLGPSSTSSLADALEGDDDLGLPPPPPPVVSMAAQLPPSIAQAIQAPPDLNSKPRHRAPR